MTTADAIAPDEQFRAWIDPQSSLPPPLLIVGAGLSFGLAPNAQQLAKDTSERKVDIESTLGIPAGPAISTDDDDLYVWADHCLKALKSVHALDEMPAKRRLASAMGLMTDKRFLAQAGVGPRGTTPRHRVLARLARENRIRAVWSFNWDCWLEASFDAVGLRRHDESNQRIANEGWKIRYHVWFKNEPAHNTIDTQLLFKTHGCVRALQEGQGDFVIAKSEMKAAQPGSKTTLLRKQIAADGGAIAIGWAAREPYVVVMFAKQKPPDHEAPTGSITFVDVENWLDHDKVRLSHGRFLTPLVALDDPAQEMDQVTFRRFVRFLQSFVRPHRRAAKPLQLVAMLHQEDRALELARAISKDGEVTMLSWAREMRASGADPTVGSLKLRNPEQRAPLPQPLRPQVQSAVGAGN